jgi:LPXTG-motif cell wall-anchored protein
MVWPATGVVAISWVIAIAALLVAALLFYLAHRTKRLSNRLDAARVRRAA